LDLVRIEDMVGACPVIDDPDVAQALEWLTSVSRSPTALRDRLRAAQEFYRANSVSNGIIWPETSRLLIPRDSIASYLAQADALLTDRRVYDLSLASRVIPFIKHIGRNIELLREVPGAVSRAQRMLEPSTEHPDGSLYELIAAIRYGGECSSVEFVTESNIPTSDLRARVNGIPADFNIETKRLRASVYELRELATVRLLFAEFERIVHAKRISTWVDVQFRQELGYIPRHYVAQRVSRALESPFILPNGYAWEDEFGSGVVREANIDAVLEDIRASYLLVGPKLARLLTGSVVPANQFQLVIRAVPHRTDPRYIDRVAYASVLTWTSASERSIDARAKHVRSKLAEIDKQMQTTDYGIAHIGMEAERDIPTADLRRERNLAAVRSFSPSSRLAEVHLHYYLPRVTEVSAWMIDETVDSNGVLEIGVLEDARLLPRDEADLDTDLPAWHLPPPPPPTS
jgi:hypothetical protein